VNLSGSGETAGRILARTLAALLPVLLAFAVVVGLLLVVGAPPWQSLRLIWDGSAGSGDKFGNTLMAWVPLTLAGAGLVLTFTAGLWNIGIEGQIVMGAISATWVGRTAPGGTAVLLLLMMLSGVVGGTLWALLVGVLKTRGHVNEIFGGLGLDFAASGLAVYLIIGPWKRSGIASTSGTNILRPEAALLVFGTTRLSLVAVGIAVAALVFVYLLIRGTRFGLRLRAVGRNPRSAYLMGIPTDRYLLGSFAVCGALAGIAGAIQVAGVWHKLVPAISGGYGFLAILVVLLAGFRVTRIAPIALFFAIVAVGSSQLTLFLNLNSAVGNVLQAVIVLFVILAGGYELRRAGRRRKGARPQVEAAATLTEATQAAPVEQPVSAEP
jgi:general nucleoside transport system permease protein